MSLLRGRRPSKLDEDELTVEPQELQNTHTGWLTKKKAFNSTKEVWCSVTGRWLSFWKSASEQQASKSFRSSNFIDMSSAQQVIQSMTPHTPYGFDITTSKDKTTLRAKSSKDCDQWIERLQMAMQYQRRESIRQSSLHNSTIAGSPSGNDAHYSEIDYSHEYADPFESPSQEAKNLSNITQSSEPVAADQYAVINKSTSETEHISVKSVSPPTPAANQDGLYEEITPIALRVDHLPTSHAHTVSSSNSHQSIASPPLVNGITSIPEVPESDNDATETTSEPLVKTPTPMARVTKPIPIDKRGGGDKTSPVPVAKVRPQPRSVRKATESIIPMPLLAEEESTMKRRPNTVEIADGDGKQVTVTLRTPSVVTPSEDISNSLPSNDDICKEVISRLRDSISTSDRVTLAMSGIDSSNLESKATIVKLENESINIKRLRELLGVPTPANRATGTTAKHEKQIRGQHMTAMHNLIFVE